MKRKTKVNKAVVEFYEKEKYESYDSVVSISGKPTPEGIIEIFDELALKLGLEKEEYNEKKQRQT